MEIGGGGGEEKDKLVVIGEEVDSVKLTSSLRKKLRRGASLLSVEEEKENKEKEKEEEDPVTPIDPWQPSMGIYIHYPKPYYEEMVVSDPNPISGCSIM